MKRIISLGMVFIMALCLLTASANTAGTSSDPLISRSYLTGSFRQDLISDASAGVDDKLTSVYVAAMQSLNDVRQTADLRSGPAGYTLASGFTPLSINSSYSVSLLTGGTFVLTGGTAYVTISSGTVVNISTGREVPSSATLVANERYFCTENTVAVFTASSNSDCLVDGYYRLSKTASSSIPFSDVGTSSWYFNAAVYSYSNGLFSGMTATTFGPEENMTRAMFVTVLYRLAGSPGVSGGAPFPDVASSSLYYYNAVIWANANNIVKGHDTGLFSPEDPITREQMAVIIYRYANYAGKNTSNASNAAFQSFPDKANVSQYAVDGLTWATSVGIINGSSGYLYPHDVATRAQVAQIITNFCQRILDK